MRFSARGRSSLISQLPVPLNSSKITSSIRDPVSTRAVAMIVSEQNDERRIWMIQSDALGDAMQKGGLSGACWRHDQRALSVTDRRDQVDRSTNELRTTASRSAGLQRELSLWIRRRE